MSDCLSELLTDKRVSAGESLTNDLQVKLTTCKLTITIAVYW